MEVPFETQLDSRSCGAACLCMVYRSLGLPCDQAALHAAISKPGEDGRPAAFTHLLARDALCRGLGALIVQARSPWRLLQRCAERSVRVVLNHRVRSDGLSGHYSVLRAVDEERIVLNDPLRGPECVLERDEFLRLWPAWPFGEAVGYVLLAVAALGPVETICDRCASVLPASRPCGWCREAISLRPGGVLGCAAADCPDRLWRRVYCPVCDRSITPLSAEEKNPRWTR